MAAVTGARESLSKFYSGSDRENLDNAVIACKEGRYKEARDLIDRIENFRDRELGHCQLPLPKGRGLKGD